MAAKNNKKENKSSGTSTPATGWRDPQKRRQIRTILLLLVLALLLGGGTAGVIFFKHRLFQENPHFILRQVVVESPGWWGATEENHRRLLRTLQVNPGVDNLFDYKLPELRKKLLEIPSIESASVERVLPDTLRLKISERIPRAFLGDQRSDKVVDFQGVVMARSECLNIDLRMPVILNFEPSVTPMPGDRLQTLQPMLDLLMETIRSFTDFKITAMSINRSGNLHIQLWYKNARRYDVTLPPGNARYYLNMLQCALEQTAGNPEAGTYVDLTFEDNVVFKP